MIQLRFNLRHFAISPVVAHPLDHRFGRRPSLARRVTVALRQAETRPFQMAIGQVQAHLTALGDAMRFVQNGDDSRRMPTFDGLDQQRVVQLFVEHDHA